MSQAKLALLQETTILVVDPLQDNAVVFFQDAATSSPIPTTAMYHHPVHLHHQVDSPILQLEHQLLSLAPNHATLTLAYHKRPLPLEPLALLTMIAQDIATTAVVDYHTTQI